MSLYNVSCFLALIILIAGCRAVHTPDKKVAAKAETEPVRSAQGLDAADDPAIWIDRGDPNNSRIIGTDKKSGLVVYDLQGKELSFLACGEVNNVDLRYGFPLDDSTSIDLIATTERINNKILLLKLDPDTDQLNLLIEEGISTAMPEIYGLCMYKSSSSGSFYVFANDKSGLIEQWEIESVGGNINYKLVRSLKVSSQPEGMVADDQHGHLFVGEEVAGIWRFDAEPEGSEEGMLLKGSTEENNPEITYDIEGLTIYNAGNGLGYLVASAQGNNAYAVFDRTEPYGFLGTFSIVDGDIDGTEDTDGIDVTNVALGDAFPEGLLIVQDGRNTDGVEEYPQNFKMVSWGDIARQFDPPLTISPANHFTTR